MMIQLITPDFHADFQDALAEMHRLRGRVFGGRLGWSVELRGDQEADAFDSLRPSYLLLYSRGRLAGSVRFLPTTGPTMLAHTFPALLDGVPAPNHPSIWESSRFALDLPRAPMRQTGLAPETYALFAGMIEFGLFQGLTQIVTVTDARVERILRRANWPLERLGIPCQVGSTITVAGYLPVSRTCLAKVRSAGNLTSPVLWIPALAPAASHND